MTAEREALKLADDIVDSITELANGAVYPDLLSAVRRLAALASQPVEQPSAARRVTIEPLPADSREMERLMQEDDWQWSDLLAAAGTVTEEDCEAGPVVTQQDVDTARELILECTGKAVLSGGGVARREDRTWVYHRLCEAAGYLIGEVCAPQAPQPLTDGQESELALIMDRNAWRSAMIGLCQGSDYDVRTPELAAEHLRGRLARKEATP